MASILSRPQCVNPVCLAYSGLCPIKVNPETYIPFHWHCELCAVLFFTWWINGPYITSDEYYFKSAVVQQTALAVPKQSFIIWRYICWRTARPVIMPTSPPPPDPHPHPHYPPDPHPHYPPDPHPHYPPDPHPPSPPDPHPHYPPDPTPTTHPTPTPTIPPDPHPHYPPTPTTHPTPTPTRTTPYPMPASHELDFS